MPLMKHILINLVALCVIVTVVIAQGPLIMSVTKNVHCNRQTTCHGCIRTSFCGWCSDPEFREKRCFYSSRLLFSIYPENICPADFVINPKNTLTVIANETYTKTPSTSSGSGGTAVGVKRVQIAPQRIGLKLRPGNSESIILHFTQPDTPVDLYYLMDLRKSMEDDKNKLYSLSDQLVEMMKNVTSDFRLGFGSFIDKQSVLSVGPYGYQHHMSLNDNTTMFTHIVNKANVSQNPDCPNAGLDALMHSVECLDQIGWRKDTRKFLVFSTDAGFHQAGEDKRVGNDKPSDDFCQLSRDGIYTEPSSKDYPSVDQISHSAKKNGINIIFAVTQSVTSSYEELANSIEGATVRKLRRDSSNIVELIKEEISNRVELKHNASDLIKLKFYSECTKSNGFIRKTNICDKVEVRQTIEFQIDIEVLKCPENKADYIQTIQIYPVGKNESLIIDVEMLCECDCEQPGSKVLK